jgi:hypothetical protein
MAAHMNEVGTEAKAILADVGKIGKRVMEQYYRGFLAALHDVHKGWRHLKPRERKVVFEKVQDTAKELIVCKEDGGGADDGLALGTFHGYVCKIKRALIFNVPLEIAERATNQELQKAQVYVNDVLKESPQPLEDKMVLAYKWVKEEQIKAKQRLKEEADRLINQPTAATLETAYTLPDPDQYKEEDSDALLNDIIHGIHACLTSRGLKPHLTKDTPAARVLRRVLGEISVYETLGESPCTAAG